ncbi:MAG: hypothetical protein ACI9BF_000430 [Candidatus Paceibacteria bacterium]|jgi:hypothetical protein
MQSKSLFIAIAAFAVTTTGVHAYYGVEILNEAGLSEEQVTAFEEAGELREGGDFLAARDKLVEAGVDEETLRLIREATKGAKNKMRETVKEGDYEAFKKTIADSPLADIITSEADFEQFKEAHSLKRAGEWEAVQTLLMELGVESGSWGHHGHASRLSFLNEELNEEQREALRFARQSNDRETIIAIIDETGINHNYYRGW